MSYKSHQLIKDHDVKWVDLRFTDTLLRMSNGENPG